MYEQASNTSLRGLELVIPPGAPSPKSFQDSASQENVDKPLPHEPTSRRASVYTTDSEDTADSQDQKVEFNLFRPTASARKIYSPEPSPMTVMDTSTEFPFPKPALEPGKSVHGFNLEPFEEERRLSRWERQPGDPATYLAEQYQSGLPIPPLSPNELQEHDPRDLVDRYLRLSMPPTPLTLRQPPQRPIAKKENTEALISPLTPRPTYFRTADPRSYAQDDLTADVAPSHPGGSAGLKNPLHRPYPPLHVLDSESGQTAVEDVLRSSSNQDRDHRRWEIEHSLIPPPLAPRKSVAPLPLLPVLPSASFQPIYSERKPPFTAAASGAPSKSLGRSLHTRAGTSIIASTEASSIQAQRSDHQVMQYAYQKYPSMPQPQPTVGRKVSTYASSKRNSLSSALADMYDTLGRLSGVPRGIRPELKTSGTAHDPARKSKEMRSPAIPITPYQRDGPMGWDKSEPTSPTSGDEKRNLFDVGKKTVAWMKRWRGERVEKAKERRRDELRGQIRVLGVAGEKTGVELI